MPTFQFSFNHPSDLLAALQHYDDAGIDPAFDCEVEELERQFQELRFNSTTKGE